MKTLFEIRSNPSYVQKEGIKEFRLVPTLELVLIHTDGKTYDLEGKHLITKEKIVESRFFVHPETLTHIITQLQLQQQKMNATSNNAEKINSLAKIIDDSQPEQNPEGTAHKSDLDFTP